MDVSVSPETKSSLKMMNCRSRMLACAPFFRLYFLPLIASLHKQVAAFSSISSRFSRENKEKDDEKGNMILKYAGEWWKQKAGIETRKQDRYKKLSVNHAIFHFSPCLTANVHPYCNWNIALPQNSLEYLMKSKWQTRYSRMENFTSNTILFADIGV